jgi:hypothetical protein
MSPRGAQDQIVRSVTLAPRMKGLLVGTACAACAAALVACGGDDDAPIVPVQTTTSDVTALDEEEFVDQADAICAEAYAAIAAVSAEESDTASQVSSQRDLYESLLDQLEGLGPPPEDAGAFDDFTQALQRVVDALDKQELAAEREDTASVDELALEVDTAVADAQAAADDFGLKDCAREGDIPVTGTGAGGDTGEAPAPAAPATPAPAEPAPAPAEPAPAPVEPAPAPAEPAPPSGGTGGTSPGGSGGVSP